MSISNPSGSPVEEPSLQFPLAEIPWREMLHFQSPLSSVSQESPVNVPHPPGPHPSGALMDRDGEPSFTQLLEPCKKKKKSHGKIPTFSQSARSRSPLIHVLPTGPLWKEPLCFQSQ